MSEIALRADNLSKLYYLGHRQQYMSLRETLVGVAAAPYRVAQRIVGRAEPPPPRDSVWALNDVSFQVAHGEVLAVIGRNGAGKSTLLKILSRITEPTKGSADIYGRVGSLLEVGTGFHPELTGRENVFMNGALLGMRRAEIARDFDDIVEFAEVAQFIDTSVKYYSSGMALRLAFAVAVHLKPEILIVDEVLAVGDAQFQKRCINKMREVSRQGRTILFVSHNLAAMRSLCDRAIHLERGRLIDEGPVDGVVDRYLAKLLMTPGGVQTRAETPGEIIESVSIRSLRGPVIQTYDPMEITITLEAKVDQPELGVMLAFTTLEQQRIAAIAYNDLGERYPLRKGQRVRCTFTIDALPFLPGSYQIELNTMDWGTLQWRLLPQPFGFEVVESPVYGTRKIDPTYGLIGLKAHAHATADTPPIAAGAGTR